MRKSIPLLPVVLGFAAFVVLILDSKTALQGGFEGVQMCLQALIPALFPFIFLCSWTSTKMCRVPLPFLLPIGKLCKLPKGGESTLLTGFLGGYPIGAQNVYQLWKSEILDTATAKRLLGFCSIAGPSFIFGVMGQLFSSAGICFLLWLTQILSAIFTGLLLPGSSPGSILTHGSKPISMSTALDNSIKAMVRICGWAVLFKIIISVLDRWVLWAVSDDLKVLFTGFFELSNGCLALGSVEGIGSQFVIAAALLSFGGLCVYMQTCSVTKELGAGSYLTGKLIQSLIATILSILFLPAIDASSQKEFFPLLIILALLLSACIVFLHRKKIIVAFSGKRLYNQPIR